MTAVDTTVALTDAQIAGLKAAGVTAVSRYIAPQPWKRITPPEYARIIAGGLQVSLNWESGAQDLKTLGPSSTASYAQQAVQQAKACGYPAGCVILNSADWDVKSGDWPTVAANLRAIRPIYRAAGYGLGLYAPWDALGWAQRDGLVDVYWQAGMSWAWSGGRNSSAWPGAHLRQRRNATIAGVPVDVNDILIPAFGQAGAGNTPSITGADMLDLTTVIPGTVYAPDDKPRTLELLLLDLHQALNPYQSPWQNEALRNSRAAVASLAGLSTQVTALTAAVHALATGGTSVDTAAILAHIDQVAAAESATVVALQAQVTDLEHKLAAAGSALAG